jgi:diacylglycerol kinase (CTP)
MTDMAGGGGSAALVLVGCVSGIVLFQFLVSRRPGSLPSASGEMSTTRKDLHVQRKLQHAGTGLLIYVATRLFPWRTASAVLMLCALAFLALHGARAASKRVDALFLRCFHGILRRDEAQRRAVPAAFFFLLGAALVLALYSPALARLAILHVRLMLL